MQYFIRTCTVALQLPSTPLKNTLRIAITLHIRIDYVAGKLLLQLMAHAAFVWHSKDYLAGGIKTPLETNLAEVSFSIINAFISTLKCCFVNFYSRFDIFFSWFSFILFFIYRHMCHPLYEMKRRRTPDLRVCVPQFIAGSYLMVLSKSFMFQSKFSTNVFSLFISFHCYYFNSTDYKWLIVCKSRYLVTRF